MRRDRGYNKGPPLINALNVCHFVRSNFHIEGTLTAKPTVRVCERDREGRRRKGLSRLIPLTHCHKKHHSWCGHHVSFQSHYPNLLSFSQFSSPSVLTSCWLYSNSKQPYFLCHHSILILEYYIIFFLFCSSLNNLLTYISHIFQNNNHLSNGSCCWSS